ncbi:hypothetical protein ACFQY0_19605 [Haloferula chungangensis]|uniref:Uncharacterized protein n=1 Tax=Haloferula chungangensis TaxID=1048331 RepID=A0ABW2LAE4_9BACT
MKPLDILSLSLLFSTISGQISGATSSPQFSGLGDLPGGNVRSVATGVSADGSSVSGNSSSTSSSSLPNVDTEGYRWTEPGGMLKVGFLPLTSPASTLSGLSADGKIATGYAAFGLGASSNRAVRWVEGSGLSNIGTLSGGSFQYSEGRDISDDGLRIVGQSSSSAGFRGFLWTSGGSPTMLNLGVVASGNLGGISEANGISGNGLMVVGSSTANSGTPATDTTPEIITSQQTQAFKYSVATSRVGLGDLAGGPVDSSAYAASYDGAVIVGYGTPGTSINHGVIWTDSGMQSVGDLPGGAEACRLYDVNADGTIAVGLGNDETGRAAVIWDADNGLRKLSTLISGLGIDLSGWKLETAQGISADGDVIVGNGTNPAGKKEAWRLTGALALYAEPEPESPAPSLALGKVMSFATTPGNVYQAEYSDDASNWFSLGNSHSTIGAASPSPHSIADPNPPSDSRSYRLTLLPGSTSASPPAFTISEGAVLSFPTDPGYIYQAEYSPNLSNWSNLGSPIPTTGDTVGIIHTVFQPFTVFPSPSPARNNYRLRIDEP